MKPIQALLALSLCLSALPALASDSSTKLDDATRASITTLLTDQGYEVRQIKMEDGMYEAYALKDGQKFEIYLNDKFEIVRTEQDD